MFVCTLSILPIYLLKVLFFYVLFPPPPLRTALLEATQECRVERGVPGRR